MNDSYLKNEVEKIIKSNEWEFPLNHAMATANILANFKGMNLKIFDMKNAKSALCSYNVLATASNTTQAKTMADEIALQLKNQGAKVLSQEGYDSADWILIDTGDIIVHVFLESTRSIYDLDFLFRTIEQVKIPDEFYFGKPQERIESKDQQLKNYF